MGQRGPEAGSVRTVEAHRIATEGDRPQAVRETVAIAVEAALTLDVAGVDSYTLLCAPTDAEALAYGFALSEGLVESASEIAEVRRCQDDDSILRIRLTTPVPRIGDEGRNLLIVSSCGLCGAESLGRKLAALPQVGDALRVDCATLRRAAQALGPHQALFAATGGTHAVALFDAAGELVAWAEDTGRHNALDKAIGKTLLAGRSPAGTGAVLSGRVSLEMVGKCARAGIELISAVSAPTSLAIEVAERVGITLCAFVRETRATVFTHRRRVRGLAP